MYKRTCFNTFICRINKKIFDGWETMFLEQNTSDFFADEKKKFLAVLHSRYNWKIELQILTLRASL